MRERRIQRKKKEPEELIEKQCVEGRKVDQSKADLQGKSEEAAQVFPAADPSKPLSDVFVLFISAIHSLPSLTHCLLPLVSGAHCLPARTSLLTHQSPPSSATMADSNDSRQTVPARSSKPVSEALLNEKVLDILLR